MSRDYKLYITDIVESCDRLIEYTDGHSLKTFSDDPLTVDAVARNLEIIGEAVKNIPESILSQQPQILWSDIARFRDVIAHHYFRVKLNVVWNIIQAEIGPLRSAAVTLLAVPEE